MRQHFSNWIGRRPTNIFEERRDKIAAFGCSTKRFAVEQWKLSNAQSGGIRPQERNFGIRLLPLKFETWNVNSNLQKMIEKRETKKRTNCSPWRGWGPRSWWSRCCGVLSCVSAAPELEGGGYSEEGHGHSSQPHPCRRNLGMKTFPRYELLKIIKAVTNLHQRGCLYDAGKTILHCNQTRGIPCTASSLSSRCQSMPFDLQKVRNSKNDHLCTID